MKRASSDDNYASVQTESREQELWRDLPRKKHVQYLEQCLSIFFKKLKIVMEHQGKSSYRLKEGEDEIRRVQGGMAVDSKKVKEKKK